MTSPSLTPSPRARRPVTVAGTGERPGFSPRAGPVRAWPGHGLTQALRPAAGAGVKLSSSPSQVNIIVLVIRETIGKHGAD